MSFTPSFCEVRSIDKREDPSDTVFNLLPEKAWFQISQQRVVKDFESLRQSRADPP